MANIISKLFENITKLTSGLIGNNYNLDFLNQRKSFCIHLKKK